MLPPRPLLRRDLAAHARRASPFGLAVSASVSRVVLDIGEMRL